MNEKDTQNPRPKTRRFSNNLLSLLQVVFVVCIFMALNFLSSQHPRPLDLSDNLGFTLSRSTVRYITSPSVQDLEQPIDLIVAFRADSHFYDKVRPLAEEYARLSGGKIRLRVVDPIRANDAAESLAAEYGVIFSQDMVIIDARGSQERAAPGGEGLSPHIHIARIEDMLVFETDANQQRTARAILAEDAIRAGLLEAIEGRRRKMWVLADKSDLTSEANAGLWAVLAANLLSQNILPERVSFADVERVPDDVEAIAVIDAAYDFTSEEIKVLEEYWSRPRSAILATFGSHDPPRLLRAFLREHGVTPRTEQVVTEKKDVIRTSVVARISEGMEFTRDLWEKTTGFEGATRALEVREGAEDLLNRRIQPFTLVESESRYWGETKFPSESVAYDPEEDLAGPVPMAAAVLRGNATDDRTADRVSRMIVIGNSAFMRPDNVRKLNLDLLASCANWLVGRESLAGESARNIPIYRLPLLEPQITYINRVNFLIIPVLLLTIGAMVWSARRV